MALSGGLALWHTDDPDEKMRRRTLPFLCSSCRLRCLLICLVLRVLSLSYCVTSKVLEERKHDNYEAVEQASTTARRRRRQQHHAIVTLVTTHAYVAGALVLAASLDKVHASGDRIVVVVTDDERSDITEQDIRDLGTVGWQVRVIEHSIELQCRVSPEIQSIVERQAPGLIRYWGTCVKFACWNMTDYDAILVGTVLGMEGGNEACNKTILATHERFYLFYGKYMDADGIALTNPDYLFGYVNDAEFKSLAAVPEPCPPEQTKPCGDGFQTALLLVKPSMAVYEYLLGLASKRNAPEGELPLLNKVFRNTWLRLPKFAMVAGSHTDRPRKQEGRLEVDWSKITTYDFAGPVEYKPWNTYELHRATNNKFVLPGIGQVPEYSPLYHNNLYPQWLWNEYYEEVLQKLMEGNNDDDNKVEDTCQDQRT